MQKTFYIDDLCFVIPFKLLRKTPNVEFNIIPIVDGLASIDRVKHEAGALSPSIPNFRPKKEGDRPWYMHPDQEDNLTVFEGRRIVDLYRKEHGRVESFEITPDYVKHLNAEAGEKIIQEGPCIFGWPTHVFHRVESPDGSMSSNFAVHFEGFDIEDNFNIYELDTTSGVYDVARPGYEDQPD